MAVRDLLTVSFRATTFKIREKRFSFPGGCKKPLGFRGGSKAALLITKMSGEVIFCGISKFISGPEITEAATVKYLGFGQRICVTASRVR
jgi:hypothetical protein